MINEVDPRRTVSAGEGVSQRSGRTFISANDQTFRPGRRHRTRRRDSVAHTSYKARSGAGQAQPNAAAHGVRFRDAEDARF